MTAQEKDFLNDNFRMSNTHLCYITYTEVTITFLRLINNKGLEKKLEKVITEQNSERNVSNF